MVELNKSKERFSQIWDFIKRKWKELLVVLILVISVTLTILFNICGYLDTFQFLTDLFSGLIVVLVGWVLAWIIVHRYQRNREKKENVNFIIDQLSETRKLFDEILTAWFEIKTIARKQSYWDKPKNVDLIRKKIYFFDLHKSKTLLKLRNTFPEWNTKKILYSFDEEIIELDLETLLIDLARYAEKIIDSISNSKFSEEISNEITGLDRKISSFFRAVTLDLIF